METITRWLEKNALNCPFKQEWGFECAGCGLQRSIALLLKGNVIAAYNQYPPLPFIVIAIFCTCAYLISRNKLMLKALQWSYAATMGVVLVYFGYMVFSQI